MSLSLVLMLLFATQASGAEDLLNPPPFETFLVIPLRVHVLTSEDLPDVDCKLRDEDVIRILRKVNGIWNKAGIHWGLESLRREPAEKTQEFRLARDLDGPVNLGRYLRLVPPGPSRMDGMNVYYIHKFAVNGVWLGDGVAFVQDTAKLREVEGGIDEPIPRVTAHELGHALGLPHRQARTNLLASGTTGTILNRKEAETVRNNAKEIPGVNSVAELRNEASKAEAAGNLDRARQIWAWLSEIPGSGAEPHKETKRIEARQAALESVKKY